MTTYLLVCTVALVASGLTLFSGFGLGTLLMPAFAVVFPLEIAIAATAVVHLLNNLFKLALLGSRASLRIVVAFGIPGMLGAFLGASLLRGIVDTEALVSYSAFGRELEITTAKLVIAVLIAGFALWDLLPGGERLTFRPAWLPLGGVLAGTFGGLSGHQGALRSAFLLQCGLTKETFIASGVACATMIDVVRLIVYGRGSFALPGDAAALGPIVAATGAAFLGAFLGVRLMGKITLEGVRRLVGGLLLAIAVGLGTGVL